LNNLGKGWFNMKEKNKETYEFSKLKKFLSIVKYIMQDSLYTLAKLSSESFLQSFSKFIPNKVEILSSIQVINNYNSVEFTSEEIGDDVLFTLFSVDVIENKTTKKFDYNINIKD